MLVVWELSSRDEWQLLAVSSRSRLLVSAAVDAHLVVATLLSPSTADLTSSCNFDSSAPDALPNQARQARWLNAALPFPSDY